MSSPAPRAPRHAALCPPLIMELPAESAMPPADASKESPEKQERKAKSPAGPPEKDGEPVRGDEYFLPAKLYPSEKPGSTPYGRGWIANVLKLFGRRGTRIVQFKVKGEDPVEMQLAEFVKQCKRTDSLTAKATADSPKGATRKADAAKESQAADAELAPGDEYFLPAKLYPSEKPGSTPYGRGWIANVLKLFGRRGTKIVQFQVKGEDPVEMQLAEFVKQCKRTDSLTAKATADSPKGAKRKADAVEEPAPAAKKEKKPSGKQAAAPEAEEKAAKQAAKEAAKAAKAAAKAAKADPRATKSEPGEPAPGDEHFLPARLYPGEKPGSTPYGRGWVAHVVQMLSDKGARLVQFQVEGEEPVELSLADFTRLCKRTDTLTRRTSDAGGAGKPRKDQGAGSKRCLLYTSPSPRDS